MKKHFLFSIALFAGLISVKAQDDMPLVWESRMDHKIVHTGTGTEERGFSYAASDKEITVFDNKTGKL